MEDDTIKIVLLTIGGVFAFIVGSDNSNTDKKPDEQVYPQQSQVEAQIQSYDAPTVKVDGRDYCTGWIPPAE